MVVREGNKDDAKGVAKVHVDSWRSTYNGIISDQFLNNLSYEKSEKRFRDKVFSPNSSEYVFVAENNQKDIVGFVIGGRNRTEHSNYDGEIYAIYILEEYQKQGIGTKLINAMKEQFIKIGINTYVIWVLIDNPSKHFYEKIGGELVSTQTIQLGDEDLEEISYGFEVQ